MTDQPNNMTADDLLACLEECSKRLRPAQETVLSEIKTENLRDNGASNTLKRNDNIEFLHFSAAGREDIYTYAHAREREVRDPLTHTCIFRRKGEKKGETYGNRGFRLLRWGFVKRRFIRKLGEPAKMLPLRPAYPYPRRYPLGSRSLPSTMRRKSLPSQQSRRQ